MTNLLIGFPDVSYTSSIIAHTTEDSDYPAENVILGGRDDRYKTSAAVSSSNIDFDAGVGNTAQPEFLILSEVHKFTEKLVASSTLDIDFSSDDNSSFTTPDTDTATIDSSDLVGPNNEDYILTATFSAAERYHRVSIDTGSDSFTHVWSKVYFGSLFDMGRDPYRINSLEVRTGRKTYRKMTIQWSGISDAKRASFYTSVGEFAGYAGFFLYDPGDYILNGNRLLHVRIAAPIVSTRWKDNNDISLEVIEIL